MKEKLPTEFLIRTNMASFPEMLCASADGFSGVKRVLIKLLKRLQWLVAAKNHATTAGPFTT